MNLHIIRNPSKLPKFHQNHKNPISNIIKQIGIFKFENNFIDSFELVPIFSNSI